MGQSRFIAITTPHCSLCNNLKNISDKEELGIELVPFGSKESDAILKKLKTPIRYAGQIVDTEIYEIVTIDDVRKYKQEQ